MGLKLPITRIKNIKNDFIQLKSPKVVNFFGDRVKSVSCIIGPNGSGKTNLTEAILNAYNNSVDNKTLAASKAPLSYIMGYYTTAINTRISNHEQNLWFDLRKPIGILSLSKISDVDSLVENNHWQLLETARQIQTTKRYEDRDFKINCKHTSLIYFVTKHLDRVNQVLSTLQKFNSSWGVFENSASNSYRHWLLRYYLTFNTGSNLPSPDKNLNKEKHDNDSNSDFFHYVRHKLSFSDKRVQDIFSKSINLFERLIANSTIIDEISLNGDTNFSNEICDEIISLQLQILNIPIEYDDSLLRPLKLPFDISLEAKNTVEKESRSPKKENSYAFSTGQITFNILKARIKHFIANVSSTNSQNEIVLILDEIDICLHPQKQTEHFKELLEILNESNKNVHLIITTHSPIITSDIPSSHIYNIDNGMLHMRRNTPSFAVSISKILTRSFDMKGKMIGSHASNKLQDILKQLQKFKKLPYSKKCISLDKDLEILGQTIEIVEEDWLKQLLQDELDEVVSKLTQ